MTAVDQSDTVGEFVTRSNAYFERIETAMDHLVTAIECYDADPRGFEEAVTELDRLESECDGIVGELRSLLATSMDPNFRGLYLASGTVIEFYETADRIVNRAERFGDDLAAMEPDLSEETHAEMAKSARTIADATTHLSRAGMAQIRELSDPEIEAEVHRDTEQIRALEGRCDDHRATTVRRAFAEREQVEALLVRELADELDGIANAVEDAADRLVYVNHHRF